MNAARAGVGQAYAQLACIFGIGAGHEGGRFLMAHLDEADLLLVRPQRFHDAVNAVSGKAEDGVYSPIHQAFNHHVSSSLGHKSSLPLLLVRMPRFWLLFPSREAFSTQQPAFSP